MWIAEWHIQIPQELASVSFSRGSPPIRPHNAHIRTINGEWSNLSPGKVPGALLILYGTPKFFAFSHPFPRASANPVLPRSRDLLIRKVQRLQWSPKALIREQAPEGIYSYQLLPAHLLNGFHSYLRPSVGFCPPAVPRLECRVPYFLQPPNSLPPNIHLRDLRDDWVGAESQ